MQKDIPLRDSPVMLSEREASPRFFGPTVLRMTKNVSMDRIHSPPSREGN